MGPAAAPRGLLKDQDPLVREYAADALGRIGNASQGVVDALSAAVTDENPQVRAEAVNALLSLDIDSETRIALVVDVLNDADPSVVAPALNTIAEYAKAGTPTLITALENPKSRYWGCLIAAEMGPRAKHAVSALEKAAKDQYPEIRMEALLALGAIGPDASEALSTVTAALNDKSPAVQYAAMYALGEIRDSSSAPTIAKYLDSQDVMLRELSAWALARVNPDDTEARQRALTTLVESLESDNPAVRGGAARALTDFPEQSGEFAEALSSLLADKDYTVVANAIQTLSSFGEPVVPVLVEALGHPDRRLAAVATLQRIGPKAAVAAVPMIEAVGVADDPRLRQEVSYAIASIGPAAADATGQLVMLLGDSDPQVVYSAIYALGKIGPPANSAVPKLEGNLGSEDQFLRLFSVWALLKIEPNNEKIIQKAIPLLTEALSQLQGLGRIEAAIALGEIGPAAKSAAPALREAEGDANPAVRDAATKALEKIGS
ncbi:AP-1 complex subunit beta-1 (Adaptor protein complex AP-1 subunit beta-1) (Adaptor-related protein complex 1 subunit beta-1) (Beta-1-adaptin) (Beta-adaptin 1) (Clathrin assembly protein complex 1 beta large chain) (Golgi adaptor HA1/AP1 adaptin beta subunit) [Durusdinium trenchii]|uniref:HEAT repeat domain-containing protein n=1 Tax=Durusdinium trenchii TaxID=1381693 RepID=A0ABP0NVJ5_9DINO